MAPPIDKIFLAIAIIAMPNLYYRSQYNVPLMLFCFGVWQSANYRSTSVYLIFFSWLIDIYCILRQISLQQTSNQRPRIIIFLQITVFVLKVWLTYILQIIAVGLLVFYDKDARQAMNPVSLCRHFNNLLHGNPQKTQDQRL